MMRASRIAAVAVAALLVGTAAQAETAWLHVRVEEQDSNEKVSVNLPLSVVEVILAAAPEKIAEKGRVKLHCDEHGISVAELRSIWEELGKAGDADLVTVEKEDETVHVRREADRIVVRVVEDGGAEEVTVDVPARVVDALLSGEGDELNLGAALAELKTIRGDIVKVRDKNDHVRVWIDEKAS